MRNVMYFVEHAIVLVLYNFFTVSISLTLAVEVRASAFSFSTQKLLFFLLQYSTSSLPMLA